MKEQELLASFWDHIKDLRTTLIKVLIIIFLGVFVSFCFYEPLFNLLTFPLQQSTKIGILEQQVVYERISNTTHQPIKYSLPSSSHPFIISEGATLVKVSEYHLKPGAFIEYKRLLPKSSLYVIGPLEGFLIAFKLCFWVGLTLTAPLWTYALLQFILPGLKVQEKNLILPFLVGSFLFMSLGLFLAYYWTIPIANHYLMSFNAQLGQNIWSLAYYIDYTIILLLGHAIACEICLILLLLVHYGIVDVNWLAKKRRYMIVSAFVIGAFLTPPDVFTQLLLAFPLIVIYEMAILYGKLRNKHFYSTQLLNPNIN